MDDNLLDLLRDRFDNLDKTLTTLNDTLKTHVEKDERYWQKIDKAEGQITLLKWVGGTISGGGLLGWLFTNFGKH